MTLPFANFVFENANGVILLKKLELSREKFLRYVSWSKYLRTIHSKIADIATNEHTDSLMLICQCTFYANLVKLLS